MFTVISPSTSANMGPAFDSMGIALDASYDCINVAETEKGLIINVNDKSAGYIPANERNLIYRAMNEVFNITGIRPQGISITIQSSIPVTRGLGSSAAGIACGLFAANHMCKNALPIDVIINMAAKMEGHPDNTTPAILGGLVVSVMENGKVHYVRSVVDPKLLFGIMIPDFTLSTKNSRNILPKRISHKDGIYNAGRSALMAASLITGNFQNLRVGVQDRLHQYYRKKMIPGVNRIFDRSMLYGAKGVYISGAGPTISALLVSGTEEVFVSEMTAFLKKQMPQWTLKLSKPDYLGTRIEV